MKFDTQLKYHCSIFFLYISFQSTSSFRRVIATPIVKEMSECGINCVSSIIAVGFMWGATNPFLRLASKQRDENIVANDNESLLELIHNFFKAFLIWRFSIPFALNQCGSIMFNALIVHFPVTVVVPCVNAIQFIATMAVGRIMGEHIHSSSMKRNVGMILAVTSIIGMLIYE